MKISQNSRTARFKSIHPTPNPILRHCDHKTAHVLLDGLLRFSRRQRGHCLFYFQSASPENRSPFFISITQNFEPPRPIKWQNSGLVQETGIQLIQSTQLLTLRRIVHSISQCFAVNIMIFDGENLNVLLSNSCCI